MIKAASLGTDEQKEASLFALVLTSAQGANSAFDVDGLKADIPEEVECAMEGIKEQKQVVDWHRRERSLFRAVIKYSSLRLYLISTTQDSEPRAIRKKDKKRVGNESGEGVLHVCSSALE